MKRTLIKGFTASVALTLAFGVITYSCYAASCACERLSGPANQAECDMTACQACWSYLADRNIYCPGWPGHTENACCTQVVDPPQSNVTILSSEGECRGDCLCYGNQMHTWVGDINWVTYDADCPGA